MPITATCPKCSKKLRVRDELVGKKLRCPGCGNNFNATEAPAPARAQAAGARAAQREKGPGVAISWGPIMLGVGVLLVIGGIIAFILGPKRVNSQWEEVGGKANDDVVDVVTYALQCHLSNEGEWDPNKSSGPTVNPDVLFIMNRFVMSMPESVPFRGGSSQGEYRGQYFVKSGEVNADVDIGGGVSLTGKPIPGATKLKVTGRSKNGKVSCEINGKKAEIYYPPKRDD